MLRPIGQFLGRDSQNLPIGKDAFSAEKLYKLSNLIPVLGNTYLAFLPRYCWRID